MSNRVGVAISTTGEDHRLSFLETCASRWWTALGAFGLPTNVFVTVDGSVEETLRVQNAVMGFATVYRVGQPLDAHTRLFNHRGVAVNKNTGLELLMHETDAEHLFLSDDDCYPLSARSLEAHMSLDSPHSMVNWGSHRWDYSSGDHSGWKWPRGVMLYQTRAVVERVGGMVEAFGIGGHEHVEYSQRIHNAGLTTAPFISPASYATHRGMNARALWACEDMPRVGEKMGDHRLRRRNLTTIKRGGEEWPHIQKVMERMEGAQAFVDYRASMNGRGSATLCTDLMGQGAGGEK